MEPAPPVVPRVLRATTTSLDRTCALAAAVAELVRPGDLILLAGELGAGKTAFCQGLGRGLGIAERITSPTFTILRTYANGRLPLAHLDVYRLEQLDDVADLGLNEVLDEGGVTVIEWGDVVAPALPPDYLEVRISWGDDEHERGFELEPVGRQWAGRWRALATAIAPWGQGGAAC